MNEAIKTYLQTIGARGGKSKSPAKLKAVKKNLTAAWAGRKAKKSGEQGKP